MKKLIASALASAFLFASSSAALAEHLPAPVHIHVFEGPLDTIDDGIVTGVGAVPTTVLGLTPLTLGAIVGGVVVIGVVAGAAGSSSGTH